MQRVKIPERTHPPPTTRAEQQPPPNARRARIVIISMTNIRNCAAHSGRRVHTRTHGHSFHSYRCTHSRAHTPKHIPHNIALVRLLLLIRAVGCKGMCTNTRADAHATPSPRNERVTYTIQTGEGLESSSNTTHRSGAGCGSSTRHPASPTHRHRHIVPHRWRTADVAQCPIQRLLDCQKQTSPGPLAIRTRGCSIRTCELRKHELLCGNSDSPYRFVVTDFALYAHLMNDQTTCIRNLQNRADLKRRRI